jgi:uncharacterized protein (TIGR02246 family)
LLSRFVARGVRAFIIKNGRSRNMANSFRAVALLLWAAASAPAWAGPAEDAVATVQRWSAAYTANDLDAIVKVYTPDAVLLGTVSPVMSEGSDAIRTYFKGIVGTGNTNAIEDKRVIVLDENAVLVTGFYVFSNARQVPPMPRPSRFTMLVRKTGGEWLIAHHHSSPRAQPKNPT